MCRVSIKISFITVFLSVHLWYRCCVLFSRNLCGTDLYSLSFKSLFTVWQSSVTCIVWNFEQFFWTSNSDTWRFFYWKRMLLFSVTFGVFFCTRMNGRLFFFASACGFLFVSGVTTRCHSVSTFCTCEKNIMSKSGFQCTSIIFVVSIHQNCVNSFSQCAPVVIVYLVW